MFLSSSRKKRSQLCVFQYVQRKQVLRKQFYNLQYATRHFLVNFVSIFQQFNCRSRDFEYDVNLADGNK